MLGKEKCCGKKQSSTKTLEGKKGEKKRKRERGIE